MPRLILLCLAAPLLFALPHAIHAQSYPNDEFVWQEARTPYFPPDSPWGPDMRPSARFPLTVTLWQDHAHYDGVSFTGRGTLHLFDHPTQNADFDYRCNITFVAYHTREFYARWVKPDRKLEIILRKPGTNETRTCSINLRRVNVASAP